MAYVEVHNDGYRCNYCGQREEATLYLSELPVGKDWVCVTCVHSFVNGGINSRSLECDDCESESDVRLCDYHYSRRIDSERDDAVENMEPKCSECGWENSTLYCSSCAEDQFGSSAECDECEATAEARQCYEHSAKVRCAEYACYEWINIDGLKCAEHSQSRQMHQATHKQDAVVSDDGSTITTDGITVKWEV